MNKLFSSFALLSGAFLSLMIFFNGELARYSSPLFSSLVAHGIGALFAIILILFLGKKKQKGTEPPLKKGKKIPWWTLLGGIPGSIIVIIASLTVNSGLGLSGSISLMLLGQIFFSLLCDQWGLFGLKKKNLLLKDLYQVSFVSIGAMILIFLS